MIKIIIIIFLIAQNTCHATTYHNNLTLKATNETLGIITMIIFISAYLLIIIGDFINLKKSKPVILASSIIWIIIAIIAKQKNIPEIAQESIQNHILDYSKLLLFLLVSMVYINAMQEMNIFIHFRNYIIKKNYNLKKIFWITGISSFIISPIADNLTTAILMCSIITTIDKNNKNFINLGCINIVIAVNAGGAFSPFGDITTLMIWQAGILPFIAFFKIFIPSLVSYLIPAFFISTKIPKQQPNTIITNEKTKYGAKRIVLLFILTIITTIILESYLYIPSAIGMMTGLGYLKIFSYYIKIKTKKEFDITKKIQNIEWDTLLFFYGIILCIGGISTIGYLEKIADMLYNHEYIFINAGFQQTPSNIIVGIISAIIDNIPIMFAILLINPQMNEGQWLLICLTIGIGGSLLSIGSAAGISLMGLSKQHYNFFSHLKYTWIILIGYFIAIILHLLINRSCFY